MASRESWLSKYRPAVLLVLAAWFSAFGLLVGSGVVLSHMALRQAAALPPEADAPSPGAALRRLYAAVLWASCLFYMASIPLVAMSVLASAALVIYGFLLVGRIPVQLVAIILAASLVSVWSLFTSFFHRRKDTDPGLRLDPEVEPKLQRVLREVAARAGTRPVDTVFLTAGTELAVFERGRMMKTLSRRGGERCLLLGVGLLAGFELRSFRAVLAHEYGHFSNRDTAGGGFALAIRRSIYDAADGMAQGGAAAWYNPAWLFLNAFHRVFLRISHGASRLQEVLADRFAAFGYGADAFEKGLRHAVERAVVFDAHVRATIADAEAGAPVTNFYTHSPVRRVDPAEVSTAVEGAWNRPMSPYDSHPPPTERIALVRKLLASPERAPDDGDEAWSLFQDRAGVEAKLTEHVRALLASQGLVVRDGKTAA
jgi:Zn-dependent protease with chaperone function